MIVSMLYRRVRRNFDIGNIKIYISNKSLNKFPVLPWRVRSTLDYIISISYYKYVWLLRYGVIIYGIY